MRLNPKKKVGIADLGDFGRGDPYNNNSSYETQPSSVSPTHRESKKQRQHPDAKKRDLRWE